MSKISDLVLAYMEKHDLSEVPEGTSMDDILLDLNGRKIEVEYHPASDTIVVHRRVHPSKVSTTDLCHLIMRGA